MRLSVVLRPFGALAGAAGVAARTIAKAPDVVDAILVLPTLSRQLEDVRVATATLPDILAELERVQADTRELEEINERLGRIDASMVNVEANTLAVERLAEVALPLQGAAARFGRFADRLPQRRQAAVNGE